MSSSFLTLLLVFASTVADPKAQLQVEFDPQYADLGRNRYPPPPPSSTTFAPTSSTQGPLGPTAGPERRFDGTNGAQYPGLDPSYPRGGPVPRTLFGDIGQDELNGPSNSLPRAPSDRDRYNGPPGSGGVPGEPPFGPYPQGGSSTPNPFGPPLPPPPPVEFIPEGEIRELLARADALLSQQCTRTVAAQWNFETNVNGVTQVSAVSRGDIHISTKNVLTTVFCFYFFP